MGSSQALWNRNSLEVSSGQLVDVELPSEGRPRGDDDEGDDDGDAEGDGHRDDLPAAAVIVHRGLVAQDGDGTWESLRIRSKVQIQLSFFAILNAKLFLVIKFRMWSDGTLLDSKDSHSYSQKREWLGSDNWSSVASQLYDFSGKRFPGSITYIHAHRRTRWYSDSISRPLSALSVVNDPRY